MTKLTKEEKELLRSILNDKYAAGPFAGMIYNAFIQTKVAYGSETDLIGLQRYVQIALQVRLQMMKMVEENDV